eukprot:235518-Ditylum_brightwellii.AAC.1
MPGPKNNMIWILATLFDRKDRIWAMSGPKNVVIWVQITRQFEELSKFVCDHMEITVETAENII